MGRLFVPSCFHPGLFLDRTPNERGRRSLSGLPGKGRLAKVVSLWMFDLHFRICAHDLDFVITFLHVGRKVGQ